MGEEAWEVFLQSLHRANEDNLERATEGLANQTLEQFSQCEDPAEAARVMLEAMPKRDG